MNTRESVVTKATTYARSLARRRGSRIVTADDVQNYLTKQNYRGSQNDRLSIVRSVLNAKNFVNLGRTHSTRDAARSRSITAWTITA
jgi:hypothetical protein